jgi:hypothetical protein
MTPNDDRIENLKDYMNLPNPSEFKLLYVSHNENSHKDRIGTKKLFTNHNWAIVDNIRVEYRDFLFNLRQSKFMLCPRGNAIDCHRNWEVIYMKRVPVMKRHPYLEVLFEDYPILFVDDYSEITEELLVANEYLFEKAQKLDISTLSLSYFFNKIKNSVL